MPIPWSALRTNPCITPSPFPLAGPGRPSRRAIGGTLGQVPSTNPGQPRLVPATRLESSIRASHGPAPSRSGLSSQVRPDMLPRVPNRMLGLTWPSADHTPVLQLSTWRPFVRRPEGTWCLGPVSSSDRALVPATALRLAQAPQQAVLHEGPSPLIIRRPSSVKLHHAPEACRVDTYLPTTYVPTPHQHTCTSFSRRTLTASPGRLKLASDRFSNHRTSANAGEGRWCGARPESGKKWFSCCMARHDRRGRKCRGEYLVLTVVRP